MAIVKEVELKIDAKQATKTLDELGGSFEDVYGEVQPLSGRIGELEDRLYEMALAGQQNTKEFRDLTKEVGSMKKVIIDTDLVVDGMSQTMAQNLGGAIGGVTSGFTLAQGAMAAFGVESEAIEETLLRVQSALAISEGFEGIRQAVPSFKALSNSVKDFGANAISAFKGATNASKAFMLTGIGVIIGGIGLLISNWDKLTEAIGYQTKAQKLNNDVQKAAIENISAELSAADKLSKVLEDETVSREDKVKAVKDLQAEYPDLLSNIDAENTSIKDINKALELNTELLKLNAQVKAIQELRSEQYKTQLQAEVDAQTGANEGLINSIQAFGLNIDAKELAAKKSKAVVNETNKEIKAYDQLEKSLNKQIKALKDKGATDKADVKEEKKSYEERLSNYQDYLNNRRDAERQIQDLELSLREEGEAKEQEANRLYFQRQIEDIKANEKLKADEKAKIIALLEQQEFEKRKEISANYVEQLSLSTKSAEIVTEQQTADAKINIWEYAAAAQEKIDQEALEKKKKRQETEQKLVQGGFEFLSNLSAAFAQGNERQQKIAFNITKAANIAQATMDTYKAAQGAYSSFASIPVVGVPLGIAAAAAAVAAGIANINAIKNTQFEGGGGAVSAGATASSPSAVGGFPAQFNVVGNSGVNQLAQTLGDQPLKAYVVAGDVTSAQSLERNKIEQSTI